MKKGVCVLLLAVFVFWNFWWFFRSERSKLFLLIVVRKKIVNQEIVNKSSTFCFWCIFLCNAFAIQLRHCTSLCLVNLDGVFSAKNGSNVLPQGEHCFWLRWYWIKESCQDGGFACIFLSWRSVNLTLDLNFLRLSRRRCKCIW